MLVLGSYGSRVVKVQQRLNIKMDGDYGPQTKATVKTWQKLNRLPATGNVDSVTWDKMFDQVPDVEIAAATPKPANPAEALRGHVPDSVLEQLNAQLVHLGADTSLKLAHFLAQCAHESGDFKTTQENLNYSETGLLKTFSKYFNATQAQEYARKPEKIGSRVYANRMGNGDEASQDGWKYRGRGYIQLTGKANYKAFSDFIGEDCVSNPDLVATKYSLLSAAFFFQHNQIWSLCVDRSDKTVTAITKRVNGGTNGLEDRITKFKHFNSLL